MKTARVVVSCSDDKFLDVISSTTKKILDLTSSSKIDCDDLGMNQTADIPERIGSQERKISQLGDRMDNIEVHDR